MKYFLKSKTILVNALGAIVALVDAVSPFLPPGTMAVAAPALAAINVLLRFLTTQPVTASPSQAS